MDGIVRVTNKPVKLIDTLRSEIANEALRHRDALYPWSTFPCLTTLAERVAAAEVLVATPEYQALVGTLEAAFAPASVSDIKRELGLLFACYPAKDVDIGVLVACAVEEVIGERPSTLQLLLNSRRIRRTCKFRPSIAEIVDALDVEPAMSRARQITELPNRLDVAASALCDLVGGAIKRVERLLSDRERQRQRRWGVPNEIDEQLNKTRRMLERVSAQRVKALEPHRSLITQSISVTKNEEAAGKPW